MSVQLINDKKALSERCEGVVGELKQVDQKYTKKITQMQEQHEMVSKQRPLLPGFEHVQLQPKASSAPASHVSCPPVHQSAACV